MYRAKVSILIPVYNAEEFIGKTIERCLEQTLDNYEIICVDDGSSDSSINAIKSATKGYLNIKVISQSNKGVGGAIQTAVNNASGEYVVPLGHDDWLDNDAIEDAYNKAIKNDRQIVLFDLFSESENKKSKKIIDLDLYDWPLNGVDALKLTLGSWRIHAFGLYRKDLYCECYNRYPTHFFNADELINRIIFAKSNSVDRVSTKYHYFDMPESLTKKITLRKLEFLGAQLALLHFINDEGLGAVVGSAWALETMKWYRRLYQFLENYKDRFDISDYRIANNKLENTLKSIPRKFLFEILGDGEFHIKYRLQSLFILTHVEHTLYKISLRFK